MNLATTAALRMAVHAAGIQSWGRLRSVTDWAHYSHDRQRPGQAYRDGIRPLLPISAAGLKARHRILHGMVDNVHFRFIVRPHAARLIELKRENWETGRVPREETTASGPSSWTDELQAHQAVLETNLNPGGMPPASKTEK
jgi:hypothetical protein